MSDRLFCPWGERECAGDCHRGLCPSPLLRAYDEGQRALMRGSGWSLRGVLNAAGVRFDRVLRNALLPRESVNPKLFPARHVSMDWGAYAGELFGLPVGVATVRLIEAMNDRPFDTGTAVQIANIIEDWHARGAPSRREDRT